MRLIYQFLELPWETMLAIIATGLSLLAFGLYLLVQLCLNPVVIPTIVLKSLRQHALSTAITAAITAGVKHIAAAITVSRFFSFFSLLFLFCKTIIVWKQFI